MSEPCFANDDLAQALPSPGFYLAAVTGARWRRSAAGNRMAHVVFALDGVPPAFDRVSDYFVVEGTTPRGLALARSRLVDLYRAAGLSPQPGDPISLDRLQDALVLVKLDHEIWRGQPRLRVAGYRRPCEDAADAGGGLEGQGLLFATPTSGGAHA